MTLKGKNVAIVVDEGFEQVELTEPKKALEEAGAQVHVIAPQAGQVRGWDMDHWGEFVEVDQTLDNADPNAYHSLHLPGGLGNPDRLRRNEKATAFVRSFFDAGKPVSAICHAPWTLIDAGVVRGRRMTSYPTLQTDLKNAGAEWVDDAVVVDDGLVTSRGPDDLPAFNREMVNVFAESRYEKRAA